MEPYQNYQDLLDRSRREEDMTLVQKKALVENLGRLDSMDHIAVIKIIHECMDKKPYSVTNRQTMLDLDDLTNKCLWRISYHVHLCLDNVARERSKIVAEKEHLETLNELEEDMRRQSKLKLTPMIYKDNDDDDDDDDEDVLEGGDILDDTATDLIDEEDDDDDEEEEP